MLQIVLALVLSLFATAASAQAPDRQQTQTAPPSSGFAHQGVARDAERFEARLRTIYATPALGRRSRDLRVAAERTLAAGTDPRGAMRQFSTAVVADGTDPDAWLGLARSILAIKLDRNSGSERYELPVNASAAAYIAYQRSRSPAAKARALTVLSEALKRRSFWRPAIDALKQSLELAENTDVRRAYEELRTERGFRVLDYKVENEASAPRVCIQFSERLQRPQADIAKFVAVDGREPDALIVEGRQLCLEALTHGKRYEIALRAGLPSDIGETLPKSSLIPVYVRDRSPVVRFTGRNYVLPARGQQGIPVVTINTNRVGIEIYRVGERNLNAVLGSNGEFLKQLSGWQINAMRENTGIKVYEGELAVATKLNAEVTTAVPVNEAVTDLKPGVYAMVARPLTGRTNETNDNAASQWFIVSDLGLTAFTGDNGLHAFVRSLTTTQPVTNAQIRLIARNNEVLGLAKADGAGYARFDPGLTRGEGGLQPAVLIAETPTGQYAFLDLSTAAFDLSDRGVKGRAQPGALDAYLYTDRGVYRPGETVHIDALVRERNGTASGIPMTLIVTRPDGVDQSRLAMIDQGVGGREYKLALSPTAMTGTWRLKLHADPTADPIATAAVLVEDFVPERLDMKLEPGVAKLVPELPGTINITGRYLYGPPAAGLAAEAEIVVKATDRDLDGLPGFRFGQAEERITAIRKQIENVPATDANGRLPLQVVLPPIPRTARPLAADVIVRLRESGGRTIERKVVLPVDPGLQRVGIKPHFNGNSVAEGEIVGFDVVMLDEQGRRLGGKKLAWTMYRLETSWQWYRRDDSWAYDPVTLTRKVGSGLIESQTDTPARIEFKTESGRYRLEVSSPDADGPLTSVAFNAGWYAGENADSPEALDVALDKPAYKIGETAKLKVASRIGGKLLLTVLGGGLYAQRTVDLPNGGGEVPFEVGKDWGAGAYVMATLYRALDEKTKRMPTRAIGLKWLALDQSEKTLKVTLVTPQKVGSGSRLSVPVKLEGLARGEEARVTIAAVDVGILNLTRFQSPDPQRWLFAQTRLGTEIRDLYGRLIDGMRAERGKLRSGGDEDGGGMSTTGTPPVEATLALHSGIVTVSPEGTAKVDFDLPDFNGQVRLMAVAWSKTRIGSTQQEVTVRDPVALTVSAPRFLTLGDEANIELALHNVDGKPGPYRLAVDREATGSRASVLARDVPLATGERKSERLTLKPTAAGLANYDVRITGDGVDVKRRLTFDVKLPGSDIRRVTVARLEPRTGSLSVSSDLLTDLIPERTTINVNVGPLAAFDVPGLLTQLDRYPYGCAEQTTSRALPLLYANDLSSQIGLPADKDLKARIQTAVNRLFEMQGSSGAFGAWGPSDGELWLTAYVSDFLTRAKELGYAVPAQGFASALDRLQAFVSYAQDFKKGGEDLAYALYILARNGRAPTGELRYYVDTRLDRFATSLAQAQLGAALAMIGDRERAERAFSAAMKTPTGADDNLRQDYGSSLRDGAAIVSLAAEVKVMNAETPRLATVLAKAFSDRRYTSTQEQAWMLLAARAVSQQSRDTELTVNGMPQKGALVRRLTGPQLKDGNLVIGNQGANAVDAVVSVIGAALTPEPATEKGFSIERSYYTLDGRKVDVASATGGITSLRQNDRLVVVVKVTAKEKGGRILLVDRLPAGLEIENPRLIDSADLKSLAWLKTEVRAEHTEFRDDRFVAAFNFTGRQQGRDGDASKAGSSASVAYMVRAVTTGSFVHPAATVEDMYRPERYARTGTGRLTVTAK